VVDKLEGKINGLMGQMEQIRKMQKPVGAGVGAGIVE
jgi:hypothetical protein